jgi:hypothetical protein
MMANVAYTSQNWKKKPSLGQYTMSFGLDNCANVRWRISWRNKHSNEIDESMHQNGTKFQHVTCV